MFIRNIKIENAEPGMKLASSMYISTASNPNMLAARKDSILDERTIKMLAIRGIQRLPVYSRFEPSEDEVLIQKKQPMDAAPGTVKTEKHVPIKTVIDDKLKDEAVDSVRQLFNCFSEEGEDNKTTAFQCVNNLESVVSDLLDVLTADTTGLIHISDLKHFDEYTYHHSLSVSILSMATGRELGMDSDTLLRLGRCAMLHDIGKQLIPLKIINKKGKLTNEEFEVIQMHPLLGADSLKSKGIGDTELWNGIMLHHEKLNGTGYPKQLKGDAIPLFSRIISVADVYDAITSYRSYRNPMSPSEAFDIIFKDVNTAFDGNIVKAFFQRLELYPINTIVELSDGRVAIVIERDSRFRLRPVIRIWGSDEVIYLASTAYCNTEIIGVLKSSDLPPGYGLEDTPVIAQR